MSIRNKSYIVILAASAIAVGNIYAEEQYINSDESSETALRGGGRGDFGAGRGDFGARGDWNRGDFNRGDWNRDAWNRGDWNRNWDRGNYGYGYGYYGAPLVIDPYDTSTNYYDPYQYYNTNPNSSYYYQY